MRKKLLFLLAAPLALLFVSAGTASAAQATYQFQGTTTSTMTVNNGTSTGSVAAGTPFIGTLTLDEPQTATPAAFGGGTHSVYSYSSMSLTIGTSNVSWGPGRIDVYDNLTSSSSGYPIGDSVYANINGVAPNGTINGAQFNWIFLGLVDNTGTAVTGGVLPANLDFGSYQSRFIEFNYGTLGTPWGAGNTSTLQFLSGLAKTGGTAPAAISFAPTLSDGSLNVAYSSTFSPALGGTGTFTYSAAGLPPGLSLNGTTVSGTPTSAGTFNVDLTATDSANGSAVVTVPVTIAAPAVCSGTNAVETAYVARDPGYIVVNGGLNLLDHLWTTNLNASNTTFLGGLVNWYQTGLILSYTGTTDPNGCILDSLTVAPAVTVGTTSLPAGTVGQAYQAPVSVGWGVAPYTVSISGLPAGLSFDGAGISGTPAVAGTFNANITANDAVGASSSVQVSLTVNPGGNYTQKDEAKGKITAIDPNYQFVMVGSKKLLINSATVIIVNTPDGALSILDSHVQVGMKVQWKGLRDKATNTVLVSKIEVN